ncbi:4-aminobutyrate--2-oxoglutarate transaminase [Microbacterium esteraromaticum]|uniref:(S)-3-amino-2-methylpropionate transaminase n=1 Tax=Microbacterium esteraromaticum TaxID=57043 RepID=A0A939DZ39_9MICO|nr:4-aminobutyrate--2-oxoglutarate transaminase [Microbacterium esteraromaticum]MBN7794579.1 4-aminobutyrate--2-oxoglutarate transaminase [Microbacterium esteraromaticum]MBN8206668.1 4-aminobutyrate--2-oxoglutarate transaminase [Microbacterium esteraromaticum]MBN8416823.1 4-aminobutyrate--2-oxoglutarate transaminase [Microbacterium esteraromaticum]MCA1307632.1 4-aminobutyrate--2-oxoglutarate transaminase [Microbacterium esteraromaticum]
MTRSDADSAALPVGGPGLPQERRVVTALPGPRSAEILARKAQAVPAGVGHTAPIAAVAAGGGVIVDADGNSLIDLGSGIAVTSVGNAHPKVVEAVAAQAAQFTHTCFMVSPYESYIDVAEALNRVTPGDFAKKTALFNSGAEAVENAIKIARKHTGRQAVVAFDHGYHGRTNLTMALTAKSMPYKSGFGPFAPEVYRAPMSYPFRDGLSGQEAAARAILQLEKQIGADNLAAVIIEPIQGEGGFIVPADGFLPAIAEWCRANGVVFIADEVQTGFARTGAMFASEIFGIEPDLITTAKGIAAGLPLAAVTGRAEIMDASHAGGLGGTYGGNPIACAAALAAIDAFENEGLIERAQQIGALLTDRLSRMQASDARIGDVRGHGAMIAAEFVDPETNAPDAALTAAVAKACIAAGVIVLTCGTYGNVIRFLPPLSISDELLGEGIDVVADALASA